MAEARKRRNGVSGAALTVLGVSLTLKLMAIGHSEYAIDEKEYNGFLVGFQGQMFRGSLRRRRETNLEEASPALRV